MKQYEFQRVNKPKSSAFDLSHEKKFTCNIGDLVPCYLQEILPGDKFSLSQEVLLRNMPLIAPMMHRVNVFTHFFFVPNRIIWEDWEKFITGSEVINVPRVVGGADMFLGPHTTLGDIGSLMDYFGFPVQQLPNMATGGVAIPPVSQLPFRAYQKVFKDYYRDQNLDLDFEIPVDSLDLDMEVPADLLILGDLLALRKRNLEKDYFTSALPEPQFGDPVTLPLGVSAPVVGSEFMRADMVGAIAVGNVQIVNNDASEPLYDSAGHPLRPNAWSVDLSNATAASISDLRRAFALQRYAEALMRGGRRLKEWTLNIFGVNVPDERIQRPEYLGGGKMPLQISEVIQTVGDSVSENPLGAMAGHGVSGGSVTGFSKYFTEHGYIIGLMSIMPRTGYFQGIPKVFFKFDKFDFYTPQLAHIGEQAILNKELYIDDNDADYNVEFGYTPRYAEYRDNIDTVAGEFRTTLKHWHMAKEYENTPQLNRVFIKSDPLSDSRVFAVQSDEYHKFLVQTYLRIKAIRPVSKFGDPI